MTKIRGASRTTQYSSVVPSPAEFALAVTFLTPSARSWFASWVVGGPGMTVVYDFPLVSVPLALALPPLDDEENVTSLIWC